LLIITIEDWQYYSTQTLRFRSIAVRSSQFLFQQILDMKNYRAESLKLYRDILRASKLFTWNNPQGIPWSEILRQNARKEFELAKLEKDPLKITQLLFVGRDAYNQAMEKFAEARRKMEENIRKTRTS
jgi:hypothetical protein